MITRTSIRADIEDFLAQKRLAIVGVSRDDKEFSNALFREFRARGYDVAPVNPNAQEIEGQPCFARVQEIQPPVEGVLLLTAPEVTDRVVRDCAEAGVRRVWMYRGEGRGAVSEDAVRFCKQHGMAVVPGFCPYMFWPHAQFFHRMHGWAKKLTGSYPN